MNSSLEASHDVQKTLEADQRPAKHVKSGRNVSTRRKKIYQNAAGIRVKESSVRRQNRTKNAVIIEEDERVGQRQIKVA